MEKSKWELEETYSKDITEKEARAAYRGISFDPERHAERILREWPQEMVEIYQELKAVAIAGHTETMLDAEFERFYTGYLDRERAYLRSMSNEVSSMIAGPSKFPVALMQKRGNWTHNKLTDLLDFKKRVMEVIKRKLRPDLAPIRTQDADAVERLTEKITEAEADQKTMKEINAFIRKEKDTEKRVRFLKTKGITKDFLQKYFIDGDGVPNFSLTNNNANIRRMKERLEEITRKQNAPEVKESGKDGIRFEACPAENRVRVFYPGKPAPEVIKELKGSGFRWTPSKGCWQAYHNSISITRAKRFAGIEEQADAKSL